MEYPPPIQRLIERLSRLPGIGKRSAERVALHLLKSEDTVSRQLAEAIAEARSRIRNCSRCGNYTEQDPCAICSSPRRDAAAICVVEGPNDILNLERSGGFNGVYHALMGRISPLNGIGPEQLRVASLLDRARQEKPREIILALGADAESEATAHYLADELRPLAPHVTRIGLGLPAGSALEAADDITLTRAMEGRRKV